MNEQPKLVRDQYRHSASTTDHDLQNTTECFTYLLIRRDKLFEKVRFGMLTLNAASLVGLVSILNKAQGVSAVVHLTNNDVRLVAGSFIVGMILSVLVLSIDMNSATMDAARAFVRMTKLRTLKGMLDSSLTDEHLTQTDDAMTAVRSDPPRDFDTSVWAIILHNSAGAVWVFGISMLFSKF